MHTIPGDKVIYLDEIKRDGDTTISDAVLLLRSVAGAGLKKYENWYDDTKSLRLQNHTKVIYNDILTHKEIYPAVKKLVDTGHRITGLVLATFGLEDALIFARSVLTAENANEIQNVFPMMAKDAVIILSSRLLPLRGLQAGAPESDSNINRTIAYLAPGKMVIAPAKSTSMDTTIFSWNDKELHAKFFSSGKNITLKYQLPK